MQLESSQRVEGIHRNDIAISQVFGRNLNTRTQRGEDLPQVPRPNPDHPRFRIEHLEHDFHPAHPVRNVQQRFQFGHLFCQNCLGKIN